ncbi:Retrovirus-related Pol polyprotein from transposon RE1 [Vitis vinifera]|uniref:Retrovirus-related Pol polyprotein from transposon RE1 n=1 Tax=Vitis vinifera TaxID=29760 RepID=A0A438D3A7_VITVI|nr:Retrovirus-related Pol polyprotein from transposon RE1 [Vitis vinifera]
MVANIHNGTPYNGTDSVMVGNDLWGPAPIPFFIGARYFLLLMDDYSRPPLNAFKQTMVKSSLPSLGFYLFMKDPPDYFHFKVFGCLCYPHLRHLNTNKFHPRFILCIFLGYATSHKGYLCLNPTIGRFYISRHVVFAETTFPFQALSSISHQSSHFLVTPTFPFPLSPVLFPSTTSSPPATPSEPAPTSPPANSLSLLPLIKVPFMDEVAEILTIPLQGSTAPIPGHPMITRSKSSIYKKKTYLISITAEPHTVKQAFQDPNWKLAMEHEYQALLKNQTWSLVPPPSNAKIIGCKWVFKLKQKPNRSIDRLIISIAASSNWPTKQLDVHNVFLNRDLQEQVFMMQPPGFEDSSCPTLVCHLQKLGSHFAIRNLGDISYFLGIKVTWLPHVLHLNQQCYIHQLLERVDLLRAKSTSTPGALGKLLSAADGEPLSALDATHYRSLMSALQYITLTQPKILFAVNRVCQYMAHPTTSHLQATKGILHYFKGIATHGLSIHASPSWFFQGYTDADWASCPNDRRSTNGFFFFLAPISSHGLPPSNMSSLVVVQNWSTGQLLFLPLRSPSVAALATNSVFHARSSHTEIDLHFVRDKVLHKELLI